MTHVHGRGRQFLPLLGAFIAMSLAGWGVRSAPSIQAALILVSALLLVVLVLIGTSLRSKDMLAYGWVRKALLVLGAALLVQIMLGVPLERLGLFVLAGSAAGLLVSLLRIPAPGVLIAMAIAILIAAQHQAPIAFSDVIKVILLSYTCIYVLCCVSPASEHAIGWASADTLLFLSSWAFLVRNQDFAIEQLPFWIITAIGALLIVVFRRVFSHMLLEPLIWPRFQQLIILRVLDLALAQPTRQFMRWIEVIAGSVAPSTCAGVLQQAITLERIPFWWFWSDGVAHTSALGQAISQAMQAALRSPAQQDTTILWLEAGIWHPDPLVWQRCLEILQAHDPALALQICWDGLNEGRVAPLWQCIKQLELSAYRSATLDLIKFTRAHPALQAEITDFLERQGKYYLDHDHVFNLLLPTTTAYFSKERFAILFITLFGIDSVRARAMISSQPYKLLNILFDGLFIESTIPAYQKRVIAILFQEAQSTSFLVVNACFQVLEQVIRIAPIWREQAFAMIAQGLASPQQDIQKEALNTVTRVLAQQQEALSALPELPASDIQLQARDVLINAIGHGRPDTWPACLKVLLETDYRTAYQACQLRLRTQHDPEPFLLLLTNLHDHAYLEAVVSVVAAHPGLPAAVCERIATHLRLDALHSASIKAAGALLGLATYHPLLLPELLLRTHNRQLIALLLTFGSKPLLRPLAIQALNVGFGCQIQPAPRQPLPEAFFPFAHPGFHEPAHYHVEEVLAAPDTWIDGSRVSIWNYYNQQQLSDIMLIGYGNPHVCTRVTTSMLQYILEHGDPQGADWMLLLGVCKVQIAGSATAHTLHSHLRNLAERTGLVHEQQVNRAHDQLRDKVRARIQAAWNPAPTALRSWVNSPASQAVLLPFDRYGEDLQSSQVSIDLPISLFGDQYAIQHGNHRHALHALLTHDAASRLLVYREWLRSDQAALRDRLEQIISALTGECPAQTRDAIRATWQAQLLTLAPETQQQKEVLRKALKLLRMALYQHGVRVAEAEWHAWLVPQRRRDIRSSGRRDYPSAIINQRVIDQQASSSLEAIVALPLMIQEDLRWIQKAEASLTLDPQRQHTLDLITTRLVCDAFLRGWPPELLTDADQQAAYRIWSREQRETVWRAIHADLCRRGLRIDPLLAGNVVFDVRELAGDQLRISPCFIADPDRLLVLALPHVGMVQYLEAWNYRQIEAQQAAGAARKAEECRAACSQAQAAIAANQPEAAIHAFRRALQIHPIIAGTLLFAAAWRETRRDSQPEVQVRRLLATAIDRLLHNRQLPDPQPIVAFIQAYPGFLADPYLLLLILEQPAIANLRRSIELLRIARNTQQTLDPTLWQSIDDLLDQLLQTIVQLACSQDGEKLRLARLLDPAYVAQLQATGVYQPSQRLLRHVTPFVALERADAYRRIAGDITAALAEQLSPIQLRQRVLAQLTDPWLQPDMTQTLLDLCQQLALPLAHERQNHNVQAVILHVAHKRLELVQAAAQVAEISEPAIQFAQELRTQHAYRYAFQILLPRNSQPIANYAGIQWTIEDSRFYQVRGVRLEPRPHAHYLTIMTPHGEKRLLSIEGLTATAAQHLHNELTRPELLTLLSEDPPALAPAYALLLTPLALGPQTACWQTVLNGLMPALLALLAIHPCVPITPITAEQATDPSYSSALDRYNTATVIMAVNARPEVVLPRACLPNITIPQQWRDLSLE